MRIGGGSANATQMPLWFAKEGGYYEKNGLSVESVSIPESSLALQAMLSGELPIVQAGGAAPIQAHLSGTDTVIIATVVKNFTFRIYGHASINRMEDLKGKIFCVTRFGTQTDLAARIALRRSGLDPERDVTMLQTGGGPGGSSGRHAGRKSSRRGDPAAGEAASQARQVKGAGICPSLMSNITSTVW
jgi:NitT/TauT family transport system substrate-binding protein